MPTFSERWQLPLLTKELTELAGKRQTYVTRAIYAAALSLATVIVWFLMLPDGPGALIQLFRIGPAVGAWLYCLQALGIQWFWPVIASSTLSVEKERNTLPLLLLTRLSPSTIVLEKFFSRMLLLLTFLVLALPPLACCLSLGGISPAQLGFLAVILLAESMEVTSISLMCSAYCRTTAGSLIATYVICILVKFGIATLELMGQGGSFSTLYSVAGKRLHLVIPQPQLLSTLFLDQQILWNQIVPSLIVSFICLLLSRYYLVHRTLLNVAETSLKAFVDRVGTWAHRLNQNSLTRGKIVFREGRKEPDADPVAWRETTTRALGQPRYLIGNFLTLEMPIIWFLSIVVARVGGLEMYQVIGTMQMYLWLGMSMMICTVISGMIVQERQKQTWETLLVTPLSNREIVQQKMQGIQRMIWILQAPLWTCLIFRAYHERTLSFVLNEVSMLLLYPHIVAWMALTQGIRYKNRIQAIIAALVSILGLIGNGAVLAALLLLLIGSILFTFNQPLTNAQAVVLPLQLCPLTLLICNLSPPDLFSANSSFSGRLAGAVRISILSSVWNFAIYLAVLRIVKTRCLEYADKFLRDSRR